MQGTIYNRTGEGGERACCDPGPELQLGGREKGQDNKWDNKNKTKQKHKQAA